MPRWNYMDNTQTATIILASISIYIQQSNSQCKSKSRSQAVLTTANHWNDHFNWACLQCQQAYNIVTRSFFATVCQPPRAISLNTRYYQSSLLVARQPTVSSKKSRSPGTAIAEVSTGKSRHNSRTKLHMQLSHVQKRDNIEFYLHCNFHSLSFSVRHKTEVTDGMNAPKVRMPRWNCMPVCMQLL